MFRTCGLRCLYMRKCSRCLCCIRCCYVYIYKLASNDKINCSSVTYSCSSTEFFVTVLLIVVMFVVIEVLIIVVVLVVVEHQ